MASRPNLQFLSLFPLLGLYLASRGIPSMMQDRVGRTCLAVIVVEVGYGLLASIPGMGTWLASLPGLRSINTSYIYYNFDLLLAMVIAYGVANAAPLAGRWWRRGQRAMLWLLRSWWLYLSAFLCVILLAHAWLSPSEFEQTFQVYVNHTPSTTHTVLAWLQKLFFMNHWGYAYPSYMFQGHHSLFVAFVFVQLAVLGRILWQRALPTQLLLLAAAGMTTCAYLLFLNHPMVKRDVALMDPSPHVELMRQQLGEHRLYYNHFPDREHHYPHYRYTRTISPEPNHTPANTRINHFYRNLPQLLGLNTFHGETHFHPFRSKYYHDLLNGGTFGEDTKASPTDLATLDTILYDVAGIKYIVFGENPPAHPKLRQVSSDPFFVTYENRAVWPRAFLVQNYRRVNSPDEAAALLMQADDSFRYIAIVEQPPPSIATVHDTPSSGDVVITHTGVNTVTLSATSDSPAILVVTNNIADGWTASVNGTTTPIFPAYLTFSGIVIPAGASQIELVYRPFSVVLGLIVSLCALAGLLVSLMRRRRAVAS